MSTTLDILKRNHQADAEAILAQHPLLAVKIATATELPEAEAPAMLREVLRFLCLIVEGRQILTPPQKLDLAWHEFILFTRAYADWCTRYLGRFVHHQPGGDERDNRRRLHMTLKRYNLHFGPPDPRYWGAHGYLSEAADCGACESY